MPPGNTVQPTVEPPSWVLADEALAVGAKGILFASRLSPGGTNLVVYNELLAADNALQPYDPTAALPKNQESWRWPASRRAWGWAGVGASYGAGQRNMSASRSRVDGLKTSAPASP